VFSIRSPFFYFFRGRGRGFFSATVRISLRWWPYFFIYIVGFDNIICQKYEFRSVGWPYNGANFAPEVALFLIYGVEFDNIFCQKYSLNTKFVSGVPDRISLLRPVLVRISCLVFQIEFRFKDRFRTNFAPDHLRPVLVRISRLCGAKLVRRSTVRLGFQVRVRG